MEKSGLLWLLLGGGLLYLFWQREPAWAGPRFQRMWGGIYTRYEGAPPGPMTQAEKDEIDRAWEAMMPEGAIE